VRVATLLEQFEDAVVVEDSVRVHADQMYDLVHAYIVGDEGAHCIEEAGREDCAGGFSASVEVVQERADHDQAVTLALVLLFDDTEVWNTLVFAALDDNAHRLLISCGVGGRNAPALNLVGQNVFEEVVGCRLFYSRTTSFSVANDDDGLFVVVDLSLGNERLKGSIELFFCLVVTGNEKDHAFRRRGCNRLFRSELVPGAANHYRNHHDDVECHCCSDEWKEDVVVPGPKSGCENTECVARNLKGLHGVLVRKDLPPSPSMHLCIHDYAFFQR
jgi:hypothetical protein